MNEIMFVVTNFNNSQFTEQLIDSIRNSDLEDSHVVVVDNASEEKHIEILRNIEQKHSNVTIIYNKQNIGYFPGLNTGIKWARENNLHAKYMIIGNNDLIIPVDFKNNVSMCLDRLKKYPVLSPNITMLDGTPQNPHVISSISPIREFIYDLYHSSYLLAGLIVRLAKLTHRFTDRDDEKQHEIAQEIYQGYGACYILTPKFFELFEELWAPTFLMYEEFFLAKQLEGKGFKVFYEPRIRVQHYCHASTGQLPGRKRWEFSRLAHREYRKYVKLWN
ncbi:MAG TPA: glycosyltransferase [Cellvibrio sp.]|nr:glycosyltransferase [Cellvibrio sp.]